MSGILQAMTFLPLCALTEAGRHRRDAHRWAILAVAALEWGALAVAVLAFVMVGVVLRLGWV